MHSGGVKNVWDSLVSLSEQSGVGQGRAAGQNNSWCSHSCASLATPTHYAAAGLLNNTLSTRLQHYIAPPHGAIHYITKTETLCWWICYIFDYSWLYSYLILEVASLIF